MGMLLPEDAMTQRWNVIREYLDALHAMVNRPGVTCADVDSHHVYFMAAWEHIDSLPLIPRNWTCLGGR